MAKKIHLGRKLKDLGFVEDSINTSKESFPSLYLSSLSREAEVPETGTSGKATITYKIVSKTIPERSKSKKAKGKKDSGKEDSDKKEAIKETKVSLDMEVCDITFENSTKKETVSEIEDKEDAIEKGLKEVEDTNKEEE